jgi:hypothetical protein
VEPIIDLAPGADSSSLAQYFADRIKGALDDARRRRAFLALKATVFVVDFDSGETVSFRFDHGRLTVHEGPIGVPSVTFGGPRSALEGLARARLTELPRALLGARRQPISLVDTQDGRPSSPPPSSPPPSGRPRALDTAGLARLYFQKELRIYGLVSHPRTVVRFLSLITAEP